jgi:hypothetical protein
MSAPTWWHPDIRDGTQASCTYVLLANCEKYNLSAIIYHRHTFVHVLGYLEGIVDAGGFDEGFHETIVLVI